MWEYMQRKFFLSQKGARDTEKCRGKLQNTKKKQNLAKIVPVVVHQHFVENHCQPWGDGKRSRRSPIDNLSKRVGGKKKTKKKPTCEISQTWRQKRARTAISSKETRKMQPDRTEITDDRIRTRRELVGAISPMEKISRSHWAVFAPRLLLRRKIYCCSTHTDKKQSQRSKRASKTDNVPMNSRPRFRLRTADPHSTRHVTYRALFSFSYRNATDLCPWDAVHRADVHRVLRPENLEPIRAPSDER